MRQTPVILLPVPAVNQRLHTSTRFLTRPQLLTRV
jgi:hypothetical protein